MQNHNGTVIKTREDFFKKYISHFICNVCVWEGVGYRTKTAIYWPPLLWPSVLCLSRSSDAQLEARGLSFLLSAGFLYHILSPTGLQNYWGPPRALSAGWWLSLPHLVSNSSDLQLTDFLSTPSYIIVQSPTQSPTQSFEWHVWSSLSGNNCHAVQRSHSSGASVYECIMGFYHVPFRQPNLPTRFLSITGHWNVSLPSGASLWNGMFGRVSIQQYRFPSLIKYNICLVAFASMDHLHIFLSIHSYLIIFLNYTRTINIRSLKWKFFEKLDLFLKHFFIFPVILFYLTQMHYLQMTCFAYFNILWYNCNIANETFIQTSSLFYYLLILQNWHVKTCKAICNDVIFATWFLFCFQMLYNNSIVWINYLSLSLKYSDNLLLNVLIKHFDSIFVLSKFNLGQFLVYQIDFYWQNKENHKSFYQDKIDFDTSFIYNTYFPSLILTY